MKILFLVPGAFAAPYSMSIRVSNVVRALSEAGHQAEVLCYPFGEDPGLQDVVVHRILKRRGGGEPRVSTHLMKGLLDLLLFFKAFRLCLRGRYQVIHAVEESILFALPLSRLFRCKLVYEKDSRILARIKRSGNILFRPLLAWVEARESAALRRADLVLTSCELLTMEAEKSADPAHIVQVEDAPLFPASQEPGDEVRKITTHWNLKGVKLVAGLGVFGGLAGYDLFLRAAQIAGRAHPELRFMIASSERGQLRLIRKLARSLDLETRLIVQGRLPPARVAAWIELASILVMPATKGVCPPIELFTYMQSGKPIVATRMPLHAQVLDENCALLATPQPDNLAAAIVQALQEPLLAGAIAREAGRRVSARHSMSSFKHRVRSAYRILLAP